MQTFKTFNGKRYAIVTVLDPKKKAQDRAAQLRKPRPGVAGKLVRVVKIPKAPRGRAGYTRTRWAVYARTK